MICSGKTQDADVMQAQKVVDFFQIFFLVCLFPIYSSNFVRISLESLIFSFPSTARLVLV